MGRALLWKLERTIKVMEKKLHSSTSENVINKEWIDKNYKIMGVVQIFTKKTEDMKTNNI